MVNENKSLTGGLDWNKWSSLDDFRRRNEVRYVYHDQLRHAIASYT